MTHPKILIPIALRATAAAFAFLHNNLGPELPFRIMAAALSGPATAVAAHMMIHAFYEDAGAIPREKE